MFDKLRQKLDKIIKNKKTDKKKYQELHEKLEKKLHKLHGKTDEKSQEEIFILQKTMEKLEKKL